MSTYIVNGEEIEFAPVSGPLFTKEALQQYKAREIWEEANGVRFTGNDLAWAQFMASDRYSPFDVAEVQEPARQQMDPLYLGALLELGNTRGMDRLLIASEFTARVFGKTLSQIVIDACEQIAAAGGTFGA